MPPFCSFAAVQRSFVVATVSPFSTKQSRQTPTTSCLFTVFFSSLKTHPPFLYTDQCFYSRLSYFSKQIKRLLEKELLYFLMLIGLTQYTKRSSNSSG